MEDKKYKQPVQSALFGYAYHKIVLGETGKPGDYIFLEVNSSFERLTGLNASDIINHCINCGRSQRGTGKMPSVRYG